MKTIIKFIKQVITNNTGASSKSFVMIFGIFLSAEVLQVMLILTIIDFIKTGELNYTGISLLLGAVATYTLASAWGKVKGEEYEYNIEPEPSQSLNKEDNII